MKVATKLIGTPAFALLLAALPAVATDPLVYDSATGYAGTGKHPKTAISGLILDGRTAGVTLVCYDYLIVTNDRIKGQVTVVAERISGNRIEKIATFGKNNVETFDLSDVPPNPDACSDAPPDLPDFNFGIASDCADLTRPLAQGDVVRWTFKFKKGSKLKGRDAFLQVSGSLLPLAGFAGASSARAEALMSRVGDASLELVPRSRR